MRATVMGLLVGAGLMWSVLGSSSAPLNAQAQRLGNQALGASAAGNLIAIPGGVIEQRQIVVLIDPQQRTLGSYTVDVRSGEIALRSVRNFHWDLQLDTFNGTEPTPEKVEAMLRPR
jgi:hypothetical protein